MKQKIALWSSFCAAFLLTLSACSSNSNSNGIVVDGKDNETNKGNLSTLTISGVDTVELGEELDLSYYAYRENIFGADQFLAATSSGVALDFVRTGMGEVLATAIDFPLYEVDVLNSVIFNVFEFGISMRININGDAWLYSLNCVVSCDAIKFDESARTVTFVNAIVIPSIGGDANSKATSPLTITGILSWSIEDENPNAPLNTQASVIGGAQGGSGSGLKLSDIAGVWDTSEEMGINNQYDELYTVITTDGKFIEYDFLGDADEQGENCYIRNAGTIVELGGGKFRINNFFETTFINDGNGFVARDVKFRSTSRLESDFVPPCD